jgi:hypothetical protein
MTRELDDNLEKKLQRALTRVALDSSPYGAVDGKWDSSAQKFEQDLLEHGVKLPHSLFHNYALPENMTHQKFMEQLAVLNMQRDLDVFDIKGIIDYDGLSRLEKTKLATKVLFKKKKAKEKLNEYFEFVRSANPELGILEARDDKDKHLILDGVVFGFGPKEMKYLMEKRNLSDFPRDQWNKNKELTENFESRLKELGIEVPHYVLSPDTIRTILQYLPKPQPSIKIHDPVRTI